MKTQEKYLQELKQWLYDTADVPLEEMSSFFANRLDSYEEHMSAWEKSYKLFAEEIPPECQKILDLGCGTGLELDKIWQRKPDVEVTGVDLFKYDFENERWDAVISFESFHHFLPERKKELYSKIYGSVKMGGVFILGDYIACCDEEEELLRDAYLKRRNQSDIPDDCFVHFDIPLTMEHEKALLEEAGFTVEKILDEDAAIIVCRKGGK